MRQEATKLKAEVEENFDDIQKSVNSVKNNLSKKKSYKSQITDLNTYLFHEGKNYTSYAFMGSHQVTEKRKKGIRFTTWAPNAINVYVSGDFCNFAIEDEYRMEKITERGIWSIFIEGVEPGTKYKYVIEDKAGNKVFKADPYAVTSEVRPATASIISSKTQYKWNDRSWMTKRKKFKMYDAPINIYEVHLGSWKRDGEEFKTYRELAVELPKYLSEMGYTHIELMPIMEHPLDASWGYQTTGYYSVTSRYGNVDDFKYLIDCLHKENIGVILDWVPGHFCKDIHGLYKFDGTPTYEYKDEWKANNAGWGTYNFDLGKPEVKSFLISNAVYWLHEYHIDGLRVDAVSNILYLDYGRQGGEWIPNKYGGNGNLEAIEFLKELNSAVKKEFPTVMMIAEESTAWPKISQPVEYDGLGFDFKWNMGWMNDTLEYMKEDPLYRKYHHGKMTFSMDYNYSEHFILSISHDEVVHGKGSFLNKMWGDYWNKFAQLRLYIAHMIGHPGKKLMFMGTELAEFIEWRFYEGLEWDLVDKYETHSKIQNYVKTINQFYKDHPALWKYDFNPKGYQWIDARNADESIFTFVRKTDNKKETLIFICNYTPLVYYSHRIGVPYLGEYEVIFDTDSIDFGGSGFIHTQRPVVLKEIAATENDNQIDEEIEDCNLEIDRELNKDTDTSKEVEEKLEAEETIKELDVNMDQPLIAEEIPYNDQPYSINIKIPPMAAIVLKVNNISDGSKECR